MDSHRHRIYGNDIRTCVRKYAFQENTDVFGPYLTAHMMVGNLRTCVRKYHLELLSMHPATYLHSYTSVHKHNQYDSYMQTKKSKENVLKAHFWTSVREWRLRVAVLIIHERSFVSAATCTFTSARLWRRWTRGRTLLRTSVREWGGYLRVNIIALTYTIQEKGFRVQNIGRIDAKIICLYINSMNMYKCSQVMIYGAGS